MPSINRPIRSVPKCIARRVCERVLRAAQPPEAPCASLLPTPQPAPSAVFGIREVDLGNVVAFESDSSASEEALCQKLKVVSDLRVRY